MRSTQLAGSPTVILFVRGSWCPFCNEQVEKLTAYYRDIVDLGAKLILVTPKPGQTPTRMAQLIAEEIGKITRDGVAPRELARSLNSRRAAFLDQLASVLNKADRLASYDYYAGNPDYVQEDFARYERVTAADVQRVATTYLNKPRVVLTVVPEGRRQLMVSGGAK